MSVWRILPEMTTSVILVIVGRPAVISAILLSVFKRIISSCTSRQCYFLDNLVFLKLGCQRFDGSINVLRWVYS